MISALSASANLQDTANCIEVVNDGIMEGRRRKKVAAVRQFVEVDKHKALVSVKLLDQHRAVQEVVIPAFDRKNFPEASV